MHVNKISIITLTYKNWHLLDKAISSVASQIINKKYEVEYLIVDDGTPDFDTGYVTGFLAGTHLNYRIIVNPKNIGTVASFNNAIKQSMGDLIVPLSADDEFYDAMVVNDIADEFNRTRAFIITGLRVPLLNNRMLNPCPDKKKISLFNHPSKLLKHLLFHENIISGASTYYHRSVFNIVGPFDKSYLLLEDYPYFIKALSQGVNILIYQRKVIKYGTVGISAKGNVNQILNRDFLRLYGAILARPEITFFEKRRVIFFKVMSRKERLMNSWKYPEQFVSILYRAVVSKINNYVTLYK